MKKYLIDKIPGIYNIEKIRGEASLRFFYRLFVSKTLKEVPVSQIAMIYPQESKTDIKRIVELTKLYKENGINVPEIIKTFEDRIIILEDLGKESFQQVFRKSNIEKKKELLRKTAQIISQLHNIPLEKTNMVLGQERLRYEMDFFLKNYIQNTISQKEKELLQKRLYNLVESITSDRIFSHRDFHSRNMYICRDQIYLIDFQDSLQGPYYYDIVSFSNDSYLDLGSLKPYFFSLLSEQNIKIEKKQLNLTALQRNIKALGTFGYQINIRKNLSYKKYIKRTLSHIKENPESPMFYNV